MVSRTLVFVLLVGTAIYYNNCSGFGSGSSSETVIGNPLTAVSVAAYQPATVSSMSFCPSKIILKSANSGVADTSVSFGALQEQVIPFTGLTLADLAIPAGSYSQITLELSNACGTGRSLGVVNQSGMLAASQVVDLQFTGSILTLAESSGTLTFFIQPIVNNLSAATSNANVLTQATASVGTYAYASGPTNIYRSIGNNTNILACGTAAGSCAAQGNLTVAGGTATFASAVPNIVGVGDALVYDCNQNGVLGAGDCVAFISSRASSTVYTVQNAAGGVPLAYGAAGVWRIYRAYTSLANAIDSASGGTENAAIAAINATLANFDTWTGGKDLVAANQQWNFAVYADGASTTATCMDRQSGWNTDATHYVRVYAPFVATEVGVSQRHIGVWDPMKVAVDDSGNTGDPLGTNVDYTRIEGLELAGQNILIAVNSSTCFSTRTGNNVTIADNLLQFTASGGYTRSAVDINSTMAANFFVYNNIIFGVSADSTGINSGSVGPLTAYLYNNTIYGLSTGFNNHGSGTFVMKNNIAVGNVSANYNVGKEAGSDYNISSDSGASGGAHDRTNQTLTFVNASGFDFRLSTADSAAKGAGTNLSLDVNLPFSTDIAGIARTNPWDIGASTAH